jgi:SAM-dependent methyltransferase
MKLFDAYARYYDLLYTDKDYRGEATFVDRLLRQHGSRGGQLLELGCGTGKHAIELARRGWQVVGVDRSEEMVVQAKNRNFNSEETIQKAISFQVGDVRTVRVDQQFDSVISLFHVLSYQTTNADLQAEIATAATHLRSGGLFLFDFWYGPAVLTNLPAVRVKRIEDDDLEVTRIAEPELRTEVNQVTVNYHIFLRNRKTAEVSEVREAHHMRYLFLPELEMVLTACGFKLLTTGSWLSDRPASRDTWYVHAVARKR